MPHRTAIPGRWANIFERVITMDFIFKICTKIEKLLQCRKAETKDWWETTSDQERASVIKGIEDANKMKLKPHSSARKLCKRWL